MLRLKILLALPFLFLALPMWRYMDFLVFIWPSAGLFGLVFFIWSLLFIGLPVRILKPDFARWKLLAILIVTASLAGLAGPLSSQKTSDSNASHCGPLTFTGAFFIFSSIVSAAHEDDLEVRNQLCWLRKMILEVPENFTDDKELVVYSKALHDHLMSPEFKYRASLPLVTFLQGMTLAKTPDIPELDIKEALQFWTEQYTVEISSRDYPWWSWPHASYIKWEYGLLERHWQELVDNIEIQN